MAKMFYTVEEAAAKLGVSNEQIKTLVSENKLREFRDGARVMFKVDQVDKLSSDRTKSGSSAGTKAGTSMGLADSGIGLADSHGSDVISLADSVTSTSKDDTVVTGGTAAGTRAGTRAGDKTRVSQQVIKPGDATLADTGAQTQIQSAIDDQLSLEGVGSGSGLLDLTRESDDTSLGAELLDEIYPGGDTKADTGVGSASGIFEQTGAGGTAVTDAPSGLENIATTASASPVMMEMAELPDPSSGAFGGLALASIIVSLVTLIIGLSFYQGVIPGWVDWLVKGGMMNTLIFAGALAVLSLLMAAFGYVVGRPR